ncbi:MAG: hypothetical protein LBL49_04380, partial [Clostridiales Family XIII bacterium]|nr:hypothetical protein [Clostridiales Family XIII bacterium]
GTLDEILEKKEGISVAYEMLTSISADENERARFHSRRMWHLDREHEMAVRRERDEKERLHEEKVEQAEAQFEESLAEKDRMLADAQATITELRAKLGEQV